MRSGLTTAIALTVLLACTPVYRQMLGQPHCGVAPDDQVAELQAVCLAVLAAQDHGDDFPDLAYRDKIGNDEDTWLWVVRVEEPDAERKIQQGLEVEGATVFLEHTGGKVVSYLRSPYRQRATGEADRKSQNTSGESR